MSGQWISITIETEDSHAQAIATNLLLDAGCKGVRIDEQKTAGETATLTSYVADDEAGQATVKAIQASLVMLPALGVVGVVTPATIGRVDEEDWATGWKKYFKPIRVGRRLVVTPPWESPILDDGDIKIIIDPGMAFGTGTHPTTQMCLEAIEEFIRPATVVADIGAGSGILSIAAVKLGASSVTAVDNDPLAVRITGDNAQVNKVTVTASADFPGGRQFDLVVANIIADTLVELSNALCAITKPGGILVLSGIIDSREHDVSDAFVSAGCKLLEARHASVWVALICQRGEQ